MRGRSGIAVGGCGDPDLIRTSLGGTADDPCPWNKVALGGWCTNTDARAWIDSAEAMNDQVSAAWNLLVAKEDSLGVATEQTRLGELITSLENSYKKLAKEPNFWSPSNTDEVYTIISWMTTAACRLEEINRAIRKYKVKPPDPSGGSADYYTPPPTPPAPKPATQTFGETTLILLGVGLLAGAVYLFTKKPSAGGFRLPLPPTR